jgi:hypothetical protein
MGLGRQAEVKRRKAAKSAELAEAKSESISEDAGTKPPNVEIPALTDNPTPRQIQAHYRAKRNLYMFTPADKYAEHKHKSNPVRALSTADKKLRGRVLRALRIFGQDTPINAETPNGRLLIRTLNEPGTMERLGISIQTRVSVEPVEGAGI